MNSKDVEVDGPRGSTVIELEELEPVPPARGKKSPRRSNLKKGHQPDTYSLKDSPTNRDDGHSIYSEPVMTADDGFWESIGKSWETVQNLPSIGFWNSDDENDNEDDEFHSAVESGHPSTVQELVDMETQNIKFQRQQTQKNERLAKLKNKFFHRKRAKSEGSKSPPNSAHQLEVEERRAETSTPRSRAKSSNAGTGFQFSFHWKSSTPPPQDEDDDTKSVLSFIARYSDNKDHPLYNPPDTDPVIEEGTTSGFFGRHNEDREETSGILGNIWPVGRNNAFENEDPPTPDATIFSHSDFLDRYNKQQTESKASKIEEVVEESDAETVVEEEDEEGEKFRIFSMFAMRKDPDHHCKERVVPTTEVVNKPEEVDKEETEENKENTLMKSPLEEEAGKNFFSSLSFFSPRTRTNSAPSPTTNTSKILGIGEEKEGSNNLTLVIPADPRAEMTMHSRASSVYVPEPGNGRNVEEYVLNQDDLKPTMSRERSISLESFIKNENEVGKDNEKVEEETKRETFSIFNYLRSRSKSANAATVKNSATVNKDKQVKAMDANDDDRGVKENTTAANTVDNGPQVVVEKVVPLENNDVVNDIPEGPPNEQSEAEKPGFFARIFKKDLEVKDPISEPEDSTIPTNGVEGTTGVATLVPHPDDAPKHKLEQGDTDTLNDSSLDEQPTKEIADNEKLSLFARFFKKDPEVTDNCDSKSLPGDVIDEPVDENLLNPSPCPSKTKSEPIVPLEDPAEKTTKPQAKPGIFSLFLENFGKSETSDEADDEMSRNSGERDDLVESVVGFTVVHVHSSGQIRGDTNDLELYGGNKIGVKGPARVVDDGDASPLDIATTPYNSERKQTWFKDNQIEEIEESKKGKIDEKKIVEKGMEIEADKRAEELRKKVDKETAQVQEMTEKLDKRVGPLQNPYLSEPSSSAENEYKPKKQEEKLTNAEIKPDLGSPASGDDLETIKTKVEGSITESDLNETARLFGIGRVFNLFDAEGSDPEFEVEVVAGQNTEPLYATVDPKTKTEPNTDSKNASSHEISDPNPATEKEASFIPSVPSFEMLSFAMPSFMTSTSKQETVELEEVNVGNPKIFGGFPMSAAGKSNDKVETEEAESSGMNALFVKTSTDLLVELPGTSTEEGDNVGFDCTTDEDEVVQELDLTKMFGTAQANVLKMDEIADRATNDLKNGINEALKPKQMSWWKKVIWMWGVYKVKKKTNKMKRQMGMNKEEKSKKKISLILTSCFKKKRSSTSSAASSGRKQTVSDGSKRGSKKKQGAFPRFNKRKEKRPPTFINGPNMGKDKNIITTTEQLEEFLQQRNDIILDELKTILQQSSKNTDNKISTLKLEVEGALKMREKELRRLRRETEESFRTCERLLHALTFQRKMLEAVLKIRDREIQNLRRCVGIQKRLIVKTLNVVVADGVVEMTPKQRGDLLKLVQEMGDIDINSSEGVGFSEETVLQEYREALIRSEGGNSNTANIDSVIQERRSEKNANLEQRKTRIEAPIGDFFNRSTNVGRDSSTRGGESESDEDYIPLGGPSSKYTATLSNATTPTSHTVSALPDKTHKYPRRDQFDFIYNPNIAPTVPGNPPGNPTPEPKKGLLNSISVGKIGGKNVAKEKPFIDSVDPAILKTNVTRHVLFECGKLLGSAWVSFAISQRVGFTLEDVSVLRKRYNTDEERAKAMLLIWLEQSGEGTYGNLYSALDDIGRRDIARELQKMAVK